MSPESGPSARFKIAYSYARISTLGQTKGEGILRQTTASRAWASKHGYTLAEGLYDIGVSSFRGTNRKSGALAGFLNAIKHGEIEPGPLLIENIDRLSREPVMTAFNTFNDLIRAGVTVVLLDLGPDWVLDEPLLNAQTWRLSALISMMERAHDESRTKSHRSLSSAATKRIRAQAGVPYSRHGPGWLDWTPTAWVQNPERVAVVDRIFKMALSGLGSYSIAIRLNQDGVETFGSSKTWGSSYVSKILRSEAVLGVWHPHRVVDGKEVPTGERIEGHFGEPIISKADFLKVQRDILPRNSPGQKGKYKTNLFVGKCYCTLCGSTMALNAVHKGEKKTGYLVCTAKSRRKACKAKRNFRSDVVEEAVLSHIDIDLGRITRDEAAAARSRDIEERLGTAEYDRLQVKAKIDNLTDLLEEAGIGAAPHLRERLQQRSAEHEALDIQIAALTAEREKLRATPPDLAKGLATLRRKLERANDDTRFMLRSRLAVTLGKAITRIDCDPDHFEFRVSVGESGYIFSGDGGLVGVRVPRYGVSDADLSYWAENTDSEYVVEGDGLRLPTVATAVMYVLSHRGVN